LGLPRRYQARPVGRRLDLLKLRRDRERAGWRTATAWRCKVVTTA
jgi:hypothetical protein